MSTPLILALVWLFVANLRAMFPSKDRLWTFAYVMIAIGVPILIWVAIENGLLMAGIVLVMAAWVMRWPVIYLGRWIKRRFS